MLGKKDIISIMNKYIFMPYTGFVYLSSQGHLHPVSILHYMSQFDYTDH